MPQSDNADNSTVDAMMPLKGGTEEIKKIIARILTLEHERLYQLQPHLNEDVLRIIKEEIK